MLAASLGSLGLVVATLGGADSIELATGGVAGDSDGLLWGCGALGVTEAVVLLGAGTLIEEAVSTEAVAGGVERGADAMLEGVVLRGVALVFGGLVTLALATLGGELAGSRLGAFSTGGALATVAGASPAPLVLAALAGGVAGSVTLAGGVAWAVFSGSLVA